MTDPKEALERLVLLEAEARKGVPKISATRAPILAADLSALISDRDRLEFLHNDAKAKWAADVQEFGARYQSAEAKLTALVEALERIKGLSWCDPRPELEASYAQQAIAVAQSIASQALAHHSAPVGEAESAEAYNARFDPANEAGQETFDAGWKCGWMFARFDGCWDDEAEEVYRREADSVAMGEAWEAHRNDFFARLPLAAVDRPAPVPAPVPAEEGGGWTGRPISADQAEAYDAYRDMQRDQAEAPAQAPQDVAGLVEGGWLPIVLCPTDGADRLVRLSDGREVVACFDGGFLGRRRWTIRTVAYHNPARIIGQRGGVDQWSTPYDTYLISDLPDGVMPTHFRPNDTVYGATTPRPGEDDDGPVAQQGQPEIAALRASPISRGDDHLELAAADNNREAVAPLATWDGASAEARRAIYAGDGRGMVGRLNRNDLQNRVARAIQRAAMPSAYLRAEASEMADVLVMTGCKNRQDLEDMANVGQSLMERIQMLTKQDGPFRNWTPADDPAEIVFDLVNHYEDQRAPADNNHKALVEEITREHPIAVCIRQAQDDFLKGASSATDDMAMFCARRLAALSSSIQPQGEEAVNDDLGPTAPWCGAINPDGYRPDEPQGEVSGLVEALDLCLTGGNHIAGLLIDKVGPGFSERLPPGTDHEIALRTLHATDEYELWCCWNAIMRARDIRDQALASLTTKETDHGA